MIMEDKKVDEYEEKKDEWMETFCPEESCLMEEERVDLPGKKEKDLWLDAFCPEMECEIESPLDVP